VWEDLVMPDATAVIDDLLNTRNNVIGFKTVEERKREKKITDNVNYIKKKADCDLLQNQIDREDYLEIRNDLIGLKNKKEIIENALQVACDKLNCQVAAIFLFSKDGILIRVGIQGKDINGEPIDDAWLSEESYKVGEVFSGKAAMPPEGSKYGKTQINDDFSKEDSKNRDKYLEKLGKLKCAIAVPLNGRNKTYGVLRVVNKLDPNNKVLDTSFSETDLALVSFLGGSIAAAISNFHRDTQNELLRYLKDSLINSDRTNFDYLSVYQKTLKFLTGSETAFKVAILSIKNDDSEEIEEKLYYSSDGVTDKKNDEHGIIDRSCTRLVAESLKPQIIEKISERGLRDTFINPKWIEENKLESFGCFPLVSAGKFVGTLSLFAGDKYEFHPSAIDFLNNVISSIATLVKKQKKKDKTSQRFAKLVEQWRNETGFMSSTSEAVMHPAYQQIIGMGEDAMPLLLEEVEKASGRWFWALKSIAGEDPVPENLRGETQEMIKAWIDWGKKKGYIN
jgi:GAF domain-containing protein